MECDWLVVGELKLYFSVWEPPIAWVAWKILRTLGHCVDNESMPPKIIISVFKAWALASLQINASLCEGPVYLLSCWVILLLYKHQLASTSVILCFPFDWYWVWLWLDLRFYELQCLVSPWSLKVLCIYVLRSQKELARYHLFILLHACFDWSVGIWNSLLFAR